MTRKQPYKMVVTDIDGTLVDLQQTISERNKTAVRAFQQAGGIVTLATGRMEDAALPYARELNIRHPVILYNGGKIVDLATGKTYYEAILAREAVGRCLQLAGQRAADMIVYAGRKLWVNAVTPAIAAYMRKDRVDCTPWESPDFLEAAEVNKILFIDEEGEFSSILEALRPLAGLFCELVKSEPTYLEVLPRGVSKGRALALLAGRLGISTGEVIAIGDNLNDLEMIREAGLGVAVGNAHEQLKRHARHIAGSHLDDAVAEVIETFCLLP